MFISTGADGVTWGINSSNQAVRHLGGDRWEVMPTTTNPLTQISVGNANNIWGFDAEGNFYNWNPDAYQWDAITGFGVQPVSLSVGNDGTVWAVGTEKCAYRYQGDNSWHQSPPAISPQLALIAVRNSGEVWGAPVSGYAMNSLYRYDGSAWYATTLTLSVPLRSLSVASDGTFYAITSVNYLYRLIAGTTWQPYQLFAGEASIISAGSETNVWGLTTDGEMYRMTPDPDAWQQVPGSMMMVSAAADGTVYGLTSQNQVVAYQGDCTWSPTLGTLGQVAVGSRNEVWGLDSSMTPYRFINDQWVSVKGSYSIDSLSVGADMTVWGISPVVPQAILACEANTYWEPLFAEPNNPAGGQSLKQVAVGSYENIVCLDSQNQLYRWDGESWSPLAGNYIYVTAAADGTIYALDAAYQIYQYQGDNQWRQIGGSLQQISAGSAAQVWGVDISNKVYRKGGIKWQPVSWTSTPAPIAHAASASATAARLERTTGPSTPSTPALTADNVQAALTSTLNMYDWVSEYHDEFQDVITIAYDLMNVPTTHDPGQDFAEQVLEFSIQAISLLPVPGATTISKIIGGVYNYVNTDEATDLHGTFASILDRFSQNTIALKTELSEIADNLRAIQSELPNVSPQGQSNWVEPFTDPITNETIVVADMATAHMPAKATMDYRTLLNQAESAGRLSLWQQTLPTKYRIGRPTDWGGGPEWTNESDCQGFMICYVDYFPNYYLKPYQRQDGKDDVWALKYYWLNSGGYGDRDFAPDDLCNALFQDDGAGNIVRPNALATRKDVFKNWGLPEDKIEFLGTTPIDTDWYPGKSWSCSTKPKSKMVAAARPPLSQEQIASRQFAGVNLSGQDIGAIDLPNAHLRGSNLEGANLQAADLRNGDFADANLSRANLSQAHLNAVRADGAMLNGVDLSDAVGFNLRARGAQFKQARLAGASLRGADLSGADLSGADLSNADLTGADLSNADLSNATLKRTTLRSANLTGAKLQDTDLAAADTTFAVGVEGAPLAAAKTSRSLLRFYTPTTLDQLALVAAAHAITGNIGSVPMNGFGNLVDVLREGAGNFAQFIVPTTPPVAGNASRDLTLTVGTAGQSFYQSAYSLFSAFGINQSYVSLLTSLGEILGYTPIGFRTQITNDNSTDVHIYFSGPIGYKELTVIGNRVRQVDVNFKADEVVQQAATALGTSSVGILGLDFSPIMQRVTEGVFPIQPDNPNAAATLATALNIKWANLDTITGWLANVTTPYLVSVSVQDDSDLYGMSVYFPYSIIAANNILTLVDEADQQRFYDLLKALEGSLYVPYIRVMCDFDGSTVVSTLITALRNPGLSDGDTAD
jgi:virginiamycin B lyase